MMFRSIQVRLDGSSFAEHALPLAVGLALRDKAALQVVRVHVPMADAYLYRHGRLFSNLERELMDHARGNLDVIRGANMPVLICPPVENATIESETGRVKCTTKSC